VSSKVRAKADNQRAVRFVRPSSVIARRNSTARAASFAAKMSDRLESPEECRRFYLEYLQEHYRRRFEMLLLLATRTLKANWRMQLEEKKSPRSAK